MSPGTIFSSAVAGSVVGLESVACPMCGDHRTALRRCGYGHVLSGRHALVLHGHVQTPDEGTHFCARLSGDPQGCLMKGGVFGRGFQGKFLYIVSKNLPALSSFALEIRRPFQALAPWRRSNCFPECRYKARRSFCLRVLRGNFAPSAPVKPASPAWLTLCELTVRPRDLKSNSKKQRKQNYDESNQKGPGTLLAPAMLFGFIVLV